LVDDRKIEVGLVYNYLFRDECSEESQGEKISDKARFSIQNPQGLYFICTTTAPAVKGKKTTWMLKVYAKTRSQLENMQFLPIA
jgi:hypothetical protein